MGFMAGIKLPRLFLKGFFVPKVLHSGRKCSLEHGGTRNLQRTQTLEGTH